jgi:hypothetical protein
MDVEMEIHGLAGENLALQTLFIGLCNGLIRGGSRALVEQAFDYADLISEAAATQFGGAVPPIHLTKQAAVIEQLRKALLPDASHG